MEGISEIVNKKPLFMKTSAMHPQEITSPDHSINRNQTLPFSPCFKRVSVLSVPGNSGKGAATSNTARGAATLRHYWHNPCATSGQVVPFCYNLSLRDQKKLAIKKTLNILLLQLYTEKEPRSRKLATPLQ
jgi:hypothetical protein